MRAPFLVIEAGLPVPPMRRHGSFPQWIRIAAALPRDRVVVCAVHRGDPLPRPEGFAGVIVTGSGAMVTDREDWSEASAAWLCRAGDAGLPLLGICYGHQLIAHGHGGRVGDNRSGREMGTIEVELQPEAAGDPLLSGLPQRFAAQATHLQSVLEPPPEAVVLARSVKDACQAFRIGGRTWGVQFHPEFSVRAMRGYIRARAPALREEGADPRRMAAQVRAAPHARQVLRGFVRFAEGL